MAAQLAWQARSGDCGNRETEDVSSKSSGIYFLGAGGYVTQHTVMAVLFLGVMGEAFG
ncbi:unnamed protein product [Periconia digitata]|uniref:Uncharacterized protein n=1 Tax=Periconia digitata TaxID=1303443 RepID=A0A9W4XNN8_9PLEO|nr:unnamed protein product [Periconia digitata]